MRQERIGKRTTWARVRLVKDDTDQDNQFTTAGSCRGLAGCFNMCGCLIGP
jgi:hypothetical protein